MFSVIIPTWNSEKKIAKTLDRLLKQLPFSDDEIIVINDGSRDKTKQILKPYEKFKQVKIFQQRNLGVSAARNIGVKQTSSKSKYITFVDDSDSVSDNFFTVSHNFFSKNPQISIVSIPIVTLPNNKQINHTTESNVTTQIINITKQSKELQYHIGGVVFKRDLFLKEYFAFDENSTYWEDAKLINSILLDKQYYGILQNAKYYYDRKDKNSLSQIAWQHYYRYLPQITDNYMPLIQQSIKKYGEVLEYIQVLIVRHYISYILEHNQSLLVDKFIFENHLFKNKSIELFYYIEPKIISELNILNRYKSFLYFIKGLNFPNELYFDSITIYMHEYNLFKQELTFSLSHNAYGLSENTEICVFEKRKKVYKARMISNDTVQILGYEIFDISKNKYRIKFSLVKLLFGATLHIVDKEYNNIIIVHSVPILKRLISNVVKKQK
ncbi:glycosyltransferase family 2 protein [Staphylococcus xylosus]|uniref:glycosyltransferase family 2 protein n=1 Tax=Staphylococcus xylosus TaxID=1288 RepID=UPI003F571026